MKHVSIAEFLRTIDECLDYAQVGTVTIGDDADAPDFVLLPHQVFRQLRQGQRQAMHVSQLPPEDRTAILNAVFDEEAAAKTGDLP